LKGNEKKPISWEPNEKGAVFQERRVDSYSLMSAEEKRPMGKVVSCCLLNKKEPGPTARLKTVSGGTRTEG